MIIVSATFLFMVITNLLLPYIPSIFKPLYRLKETMHLVNRPHTPSPMRSFT